MTDQFWDLRDYGVSEPFKSVCPIGNPISHSTQFGFSCPPSEAITAWSKRSFDRSRPDFLVNDAGEEPLCMDATGVGQNFALRPPLYAIPAHSSRLSHFFARASILPAFVNPRVSGVGHKPDTLSAMGSAQGRRWYVFPFRIVPESGQVSENAAKPSAWLFARASKQICDVLHDEELGSKIANKSGDFRPEPRSGSVIDASLPAGDTNVLAREPPRDDIDGNSVSGQSVGSELADIFIARHLWPVFRQDTAGEFFNLAECDRLEPASALKAQRKSANTGKQIEHAQLVHQNHPHALAIRRAMAGRQDHMVRV